MQGHNRPLPSGRPVAAALRQFLARMRADVQRRVSVWGPVPELSHWLPAMVEVLGPIMTRYWHRGMEEGARHIESQVAALTGRHRARRLKSFDLPRSRGELPWLVTKDASTAPRFELHLDLYNPRITQAIEREVFNFCQATLDTLTTDVGRGLELLRAELTAGLEAGEAYKTLNSRVLGLFDDPFRASRIAQTETVRAVHGGQFMADKESGIVENKLWQASSDACPLCLKMAARGPIPIDEPFWVNPKGGPYAVCMFPPIHPFDQCTYLSLIAESLVPAQREEGPSRLVERVGA